MGVRIAILGGKSQETVIGVAGIMLLPSRPGSPKKTRSKSLPTMNPCDFLLYLKPLSCKSIFDKALSESFMFDPR